MRSDIIKAHMYDIISTDKYAKIWRKKKQQQKEKKVSFKYIYFVLKKKPISAIFGNKITVDCSIIYKHFDKSL